MTSTEARNSGRQWSPLQAKEKAARTLSRVLKGDFLRVAQKRGEVHFFSEPCPLLASLRRESAPTPVSTDLTQLSHAESIMVSPPDVTIEHLLPRYTPEKLHDLRGLYEF